MNLTVKKINEVFDFYNLMPTKEISIVGIRGCVPVEDANEVRLRNSIELQQIDVNYEKPRCTFVVVVGDQLMGLLGSTVPHKRYVSKALKKHGYGANQMFFGQYTDYKKGMHKANSSTAHQALRQMKKHPVRRTKDDLDFEEDDFVTYDMQYDNIHAGWNMGFDHPYYASAGCQIISGYPSCKKRNNMPATGYWKCFKDTVFGTIQENFTYTLLSSRAFSRHLPSSKRIIYGSQGKMVQKLQERLNQLNKCSLLLDGDCGIGTFKQILLFQTKIFGENADDGIVGPMTAKALGLKI